MTDQDATANQLYFPFMAGFYDKTSDLGFPLIRFFTGLILMPHGAQKLFGWFGDHPQWSAQCASARGPPLPPSPAGALVSWAGTEAATMRRRINV